MTLPLVSCICPTYNRPSRYQFLVEEAIESFLRQDYPNKELLVLNDTPGQELFCEAEGVTIVNVPKRFRTLGEKRNAAIGLTQGEVIAPWDDDDIHLPRRLSYSIERLGNADYFAPRNFWMWYKNRLLHDHHIGRGAPSQGIFTRSAFEAAGGYPFFSHGADTALDQALGLNRERCIDPHKGDELMKRSEWFYLYRYGVSPGHLSASREKYVGRYRIIGDRPIEQGCFELNPHWNRDYVELIEWGLKHPEETCERCT